MNWLHKKTVFYGIPFILLVLSLLFVYNNHSLYDRPIAKVTEVEVEESTELVDVHDNTDQRFKQAIVAEIKNGELKGALIHLENTYTLSGAYDHEYSTGNELFVWIDPQEGDDELTGSITDVKRDKYVMIVGWLFIATLLLVGKKQGLFSVISLLINALLLSYALDVYINTQNSSLVLICGVSAILFTVLTLLLVNGANEKSYSAMIATIISTVALMAITSFFLWFAPEGGLRYEEMGFLTRPYEVVFLAGVLIGSLGAVMDVAISMSASIFGIYEENKTISLKALKASGMEVGKDIMGTMTNILFFAYISGSIPSLLLYIKNNSPLGFTLSMNLSLELARALAGGIGIVLAIPIGLYTSLFFINRKKVRQ